MPTNPRSRIGRKSKRISSPHSRIGMNSPANARRHASLGHTNEARTKLWQAINRDPPDAIAFAELLNWNLVERDFEQAARVLSVQEKLFHADLKAAIRSDDRFQAFRRSVPGKKW